MRIWQGGNSAFPLEASDHASPRRHAKFQVADIFRSVPQAGADSGRTWPHARLLRIGTWPLAATSYSGAAIYLAAFFEISRADDLQTRHCARHYSAPMTGEGRMDGNNGLLALAYSGVSLGELVHTSNTTSRDNLTPSDVLSDCPLAAQESPKYVISTPRCYRPSIDLAVVVSSPHP